MFKLKINKNKNVFFFFFFFLGGLLIFILVFRGRACLVKEERIERNESKRGIYKRG